MPKKNKGSKKCECIFTFLFSSGGTFLLGRPRYVFKDEYVHCNKGGGFLHRCFLLLPPGQIWRRECGNLWACYINNCFVTRHWASSYGASVLLRSAIAFQSGVHANNPEKLHFFASDSGNAEHFCPISCLLRPAMCQW